MEQASFYTLHGQNGSNRQTKERLILTLGHFNWYMCICSILKVNCIQQRQAKRPTKCVFETCHNLNQFQNVKSSFILSISVY